ncbi:MAG: BsuPI-related putative proteinase inhibitor [Armatimonadota bacterium]|nr:BsuPI-related putative proteinase inhibitor [Armatimonadota bacterium]MDR7550107.1 BsuPI-related putative proteinase inhibitor [Armatimonadota bacterium]
MPLGVTAIVVLAALAAAPLAPRAERRVGDLKLELNTDRAVYRAGDVVVVTLQVTSLAQRPASMTVGGQEFDVTVRQRGALVWQWSHDKAYVQIIRELPLAPGQVLTYRATWDQRDLQGRRVDPGTYEIFGTFFGALRPGGPAGEVGPVRMTIGR